MATFRVDGFDAAIKKLDKLADKSKVEEIARKAVEGARDVVLSSTKASVQSSIKHPSTGSLVGSFSATPAKVNSYGAYSVIRPTGRNRQGKRNAEIAAYLEYGNSRGMIGQHWRSKAVAASESKAKRIIEEAVEKEMELE